MAKALDRQLLYGCKDAALNYITNQDPVNHKEYSSTKHGHYYREKEWLKWWEQNKTNLKSNGFSKDLQNMDLK